MAEVILRLPEVDYGGLMLHLLPPGEVVEQAAFVYARPREVSGKIIMSLVDWDAMRPQDFAYQSEYHLELEDGKRSEVIKRAHDLKASMIEWHSHPMFWPAEFSVSDLSGLIEFAPHVMWRLNERPYCAVVVTPHDFDALVWSDRKKEPNQSFALCVGARELNPTGCTLGSRGGRSWMKDTTEMSGHSACQAKKSLRHYL